MFKPKTYMTSEDLVDLMTGFCESNWLDFIQRAKEEQFTAEDVEQAIEYLRGDYEKKEPVN